MRNAWLCFGLLLGLSSCISLGGGAPPQKTTIIVPQGATVSCTNQDGSACQPQQGVSVLPLKSAMLHGGLQG